MGNRRKLKSGFKRLAAAVNKPSGRRHIPTADEAFGLQVQVPDEESEVIKVVPAKVDGVVVGEAYFHDNGTVAIKYNPDAPKEALDKIRETAEELGFELEEGVPDGSP